MNAQLLIYILYVGHYQSHAKTCMLHISSGILSHDSCTATARHPNQYVPSIAFFMVLLGQQQVHTHFDCCTSKEASWEEM